MRDSGVQRGAAEWRGEGDGSPQVLLSGEIGWASPPLCPPVQGVELIHNNPERCGGHWHGHRGRDGVGSHWAGVSVARCASGTVLKGGDFSLSHFSSQNEAPVLNCQVFSNATFPKYPIRCRCKYVVLFTVVTGDSTR